MTAAPATLEELQQWLKSNDLQFIISRREPADLNSLDLSAFSAIVNYEPDEMIVQCQAGIPLALLNDTLKAEGQWIPTLRFDESLNATLGGAIATGAIHPREEFGVSLRTTVLGGTFASTDGEVFKSGSRVVKSVAGYDIHRAFVGSRGLFGCIVELTLKTQPLPERQFRAAAIGDLSAIVAESPTVMLKRAEGGYLIELSGYDEDVAHSIAKLSETCSLGPISDEDWSSAVVAWRRAVNHQTEEISPLMLKLRRVFDPRGLLIEEYG